MTDLSLIKDIPRLSFKYNGADYNEQIIDIKSTQCENELVVEYLFTQNLKVTNIVKSYPDFNAIEWVSWLENTDCEPTGIISELWDCDADIPFPYQAPHAHSAYIQDPATATQIHHAHGSMWNPMEFCDLTKLLNVGARPEKFATSGGRSSQQFIPFFNCAYQNQGIAFGIGWSGQWHCNISRSENSIRVQTGVENTNFKLLPGEKYRTSSIVIMAYDGDFLDGQNKWRRLIKKHFSLVGKPGMDKTAPYCGGVWGGMSSKAVIDRINYIKENNIPFEYIWMDAGWYGTSTQESPDEFLGDWSAYTGDWTVNPTHHPDGLLDVRKAIKDSGLKFLLWVEPERVNEKSPIFKEHPEYFSDITEWGYRMLDLGRDDALEYSINTCCELVERLGINIFRQDFNFDPLKYWQDKEAADRIGINEIRYIMGVYKLWDTLLERFPGLMIDNCASGGRRIDMESIRRSLPLWRSDLACPANYAPNGVQSHAIGFSTWIPYSGTGVGRELCDIYRFRSAYSPGLNSQCLWSERDPLPNEKQTQWLKKYSEEYLRVRPYLTCDRYPLTQPVVADDVWVGMQYHRPEDDTGVIQIFRRENSRYSCASFPLRGLKDDAVYKITDADTHTEIKALGKELALGFNVHINQPRTAKLYWIEKE